MGFQQLAFLNTEGEGPARHGDVIAVRDQSAMLSADPRFGSVGDPSSGMMAADHKTIRSVSGPRDFPSLVPEIYPE